MGSVWTNFRLTDPNSQDHLFSLVASALHWNSRVLWWSGAGPGHRWPIIELYQFCPGRNFISCSLCRTTGSELWLIAQTTTSEPVPTLCCMGCLLARIRDRDSTPCSHDCKSTELSNCPTMVVSHWTNFCMVVAWYVTDLSRYLKVMHADCPATNVPGFTACAKSMKLEWPFHWSALLY